MTRPQARTDVLSRTIYRMHLLGDLPMRMAWIASVSIALLSSIPIANARDALERFNVTIKAFSPRASRLVSALVQNTEALRTAGITSHLRLSHLLAQFATETGGLMRLDENLNYSASRLVEVFPARAITSEKARRSRATQSDRQPRLWPAPWKLRTEHGRQLELSRLRLHSTDGTHEFSQARPGGQSSARSAAGPSRQEGLRAALQPGRLAASTRPPTETRHAA